MNFTYKDENENQTIKNIQNEGYNFIVNYLDGSKSDYVCYNDNEFNRLKKVLIEQAIDRDKSFNLNNTNLLNNFRFAVSILMASLASISYNSKKEYLFYLLIIGTFISTYNYKNNKKKLKELKKYRMFLEMYKDIDTINKSEFLKCIECENMYQRKIDINTIDEFSYTDVKAIYKKYKKEK